MLGGWVVRVETDRGPVLMRKAGVADKAGWPATVKFVLSFVAIVPLAKVGREGRERRRCKGC